MKPILQAGLSTGVAFAALSGAVAHAGGSKGCAPCSVPPPCNCTVPTGHDINVPGVTITPPSITVNSPNIVIGGANVDVQASSVAVSQSSASADSSAYAAAQGQASGYTNANAYGNALAAVNAFGYGGGGGGGWGLGNGVAASYIPALQVEGETAETRRVCSEFRSVARTVAVQAVCLDDKDVPHPASQVTPDRDILPAYEGEVYRCIAGAHMQYTLGAFAGQADFAHGQTISCLKGEALYHTGEGQLACRPQRPARDCNERSLLRRYGAGIKVMTAGVRQCVAYTSQTASGSAASSNGALQLDGGVGGAY